MAEQNPQQTEQRYTPPIDLKTGKSKPVDTWTEEECLDALIERPEPVLKNRITARMHVISSSDVVTIMRKTEDAVLQPIGANAEAIRHYVEGAGNPSNTKQPTRPAAVFQDGKALFVQFQIRPYAVPK